MPSAPEVIGRRERNKQEKLQRIVAAAGDLFAERGIDEVTTQEIADRADVGAGTLFLYAKSKAELLLLVQNDSYERALERGCADAEAITDIQDALLAIIRPIVECNRTRVDNGRTYLREIVFGDADEPHHRDAIAITQRTEEAIAELVKRVRGVSDSEAATLARIVSAVMFVSMAGSPSLTLTVEEIVEEIRRQIAVLFP